MSTSLEDLPQPEYEGAVDPESLETDGDNPNEMTDEQFGLLCDRMRQNGWLGGPIITDTDGLIADGQHRWQAAQEIGLTEVPVKQYEIDDATRRLWRQELNKIHGEHDTKRDALEYDLLLDSGKTDEVQALTNAAGEDLDELLAEIKMDIGRPAVYQYDLEHNVYFEDCIEGMRERLEDNSVDMVFTSPPYNQKLGAGNDKRLRGAEAYEDDMSQKEYRDFITDVLNEIARVVKPDGHVFFNLGLRYNNGTITTPDWIVDIMPLPWKSYIVWNKNNTGRASIGLQKNGRFAGTWEPIYHFGEEPSSLNGRRNFDVWDAPQSSDERDHDTDAHPAPFSVSLVQTALKATTDENDLILDPFMGSGTTAVAAIQNDRNYIGFELDEKGAYKPIVERRISEAKRQVAANE